MAENNTKDIKAVGRPTLKTDTIVSKLEDIFKVGGNIDEACSYAGISRESYYRWLKDDDEFVTKMDASKHYADIAAKNVVVDSIVKNKDLQSAKWWLEKREYKQGLKVGVETDDGKTVTRLILDIPNGS